MSISCNRREDLEEVHTIKCCECGKLRALPKLVKLDDMLEICKLQHVSDGVTFWGGVDGKSTQIVLIRALGP